MDAGRGRGNDALFCKAGYPDGPRRRVGERVGVGGFRRRAPDVESDIRSGSGRPVVVDVAKPLDRLSDVSSWLAARSAVEDSA